MEKGAIRLLAVFLGGLLLLLVGIEAPGGRGIGGSLLAAIIDPGSLSGGQGGVTTALQGIPTSGTLSPVQIATLCLAVGWASWQPIAICLAESSGAIGAINRDNPDGSIDRGLWQINSSHAQYDPTKLVSDPLYNCQAAFAIYHSQGYGAWTTYTNGAYLAHKAIATAALNTAVTLEVNQ